MVDAIPDQPLAAPKPAKTAFRFLDTGKTRAAQFQLEHPLTLGDKVFSKVTMKRLTVADLNDHREKLRKLSDINPEATLALPIFADENGDDLPAGFFEALDLDDSDRLDRVAADFLPQRYRAETPDQKNDSPIPTTSASSETASAEAMDGRAAT